MGTGGNNPSEEGKSKSSKRSRVEEAEVSSSNKHKSSSHKKDRKKDFSKDQHRLKSHISKKKNDEDPSKYDRDNYKSKSNRSSKETDSHFDQRERHEVRYWDVGAERPYRGENENKYPEPRRFRRKRSSSYCNEDQNQEPLVRYWNDDKKKKKDDFDSESQDREDYLVGTRYYAEPKKKRTDDRNLKKPDFVKNDKDVKNDKSAIGAQKPDQKKTLDLLTSKTGGAYIPPGKLRLMQSNITDKSSMAYQRIAWEALKKSIHGHINKVNTSNIGVLTRLLFKENIIRGRGLLCRSIIQAQAASQTFTNVYACLVAIINSKFPNIGELLLRRVVIQFKRGFKRNDKSIAISAATFLAHLVNQRVAHEVIALEILTLLLDKPTDDSVEVAVAFLKEVGLKLSEVSSRGFNAIFDMLRSILHEGKLDKRVQYMIEVIFQVRKDDFRAHPAVIEALDLIEEEDQFTHLLTLDEANDAQDILNVFKFDEQFEENENKYKTLMKDILDDDNDDDEDNSDSEGDSEESDEATDSEKDEENKTTILDNTETNLIALRKTIYLTIQSSLDFEECAHKLLKMEIKPGQEAELCHMLLDCCAEQRTYEKFFGLLAQRFCQINRIYVGPFEAIFQDSYATVHRLDTNKLRNVAKFFAHLLFTDAISWEVLSTVKLNEEDTTSSSRIFIKILFQELSEYMGLANLNARVKDVTLQTAMEGLFPRDNPKNTRFAINFFTSIGLGGLTDELREHLKSQPKVSAVPQLVSQLSSGSSSSSSSSSSSDSSSDSSSSDSSSDSDEKRTKKKNKKPTERNIKKKEKNMSIKSSKKNSKEVRKSAK